MRQGGGRGGWGGLLVEPLLQRVMEQRGGRLPGFVLIVGDEESDDKMIEVGVRCSAV